MEEHPEYKEMDLPGGPEVKSPPANAGVQSLVWKLRPHRPWSNKASGLRYGGGQEYSRNDPAKKGAFMRILKSPKIVRVMLETVAVSQELKLFLLLGL